MLENGQALCDGVIGRHWRVGGEIISCLRHACVVVLSICARAACHYVLCRVARQDAALTGLREMSVIGNS